MNTATRSEASVRSRVLPQTRIPQQRVHDFPGRTLGPVSDLESHLPEEWWRTLFNAVYLKTDGDIVENAEATRLELDAVLKTVSLQRTDRILDLCCGQGRHLMELASRGFRSLTGLDRSRYLVRLARKRARKSNHQIKLHEGDARRFRIKGDPFHCVMILGNSFGYFDSDNDDRAVLESVKFALRDGGKLVLDLADGSWQRRNFEPRSWEWIDENHFVCRERNLSADNSRLISREVVVHAERGVIVDQFYAERLYDRESIVDLLESCGFLNAKIHDQMLGESTRQQDLGMMACRMLVTAQVAKPTTAETSTKPSKENTRITVLLGDPRLPDPCKRDGQFNEEDIATIERLKESISELGGFDVTWHDNHATLFDDLRESRPEFVFNLCDEGFNNDPTKELHITTMLESLEIPYSGAGPVSLGLCYNKSFIRSIAESMDIPVPLETYFDAADQAATIPSFFPALVKPNRGDSSVGITAASVVNNSSQLLHRIEDLSLEFPDTPLLIQEFLTGKEYSVGLIGNPGIGFTYLPVLEVDFDSLDDGLPKILGYESKWLPDSPYWTQIRYRETTLVEEQKRQLYDYCARLFSRIECRDYARFDFRADENGCIKLLEVNPNPGWCWDGKLNFMAEYAGMRYSELLAAIVDASMTRLSLKPND